MSIFREQDHCNGNPPMSDLNQELKERKKLKKKIEFAEICKQYLLFDNLLVDNVCSNSPRGLEQCFLVGNCMHCPNSIF